MKQKGEKGNLELQKKQPQISSKEVGSKYKLAGEQLTFAERHIV